MKPDVEMHKLRPWGVALVGLVGSVAANAADLSTRPLYKAPPPLPVNWAGFYLGIYGGVSGTTGANWGVGGGLFGGTAGFNWQNGAVVYGIEGDGGWAGLSGITSCPIAPVTCTASGTWLASARGRLGWTVRPDLLLYATGGAAFGDVRVNAAPFAGAAGDQAGWSAGAGFEWMFAPRWSFKVEYLHYDLGTFACGAGACAPGQAVNVRYAVDTAKAGFNYHFNSGPAMAWY
jgi:outer membrane immunogenic protein